MTTRTVTLELTDEQSQALYEALTDTIEENREIVVEEPDDNQHLPPYIAALEAVRLQAFPS